MGDKGFHQHRIHAQMKVIKRVLRYLARKREIRMEKRKILGERIDFDNIVSSAFHAKELYEAIYEYQNRRRRYGGLENE